MIPGARVSQDHEEERGAMVGSPRKLTQRWRLVNSEVIRKCPGKGRSRIRQREKLGWR